MEFRRAIEGSDKGVSGDDFKRIDEAGVAPRRGDRGGPEGAEPAGPDLYSDVYATHART